MSAMISFFQSIGESFSFINPLMIIPEDEIQSIQQRNRQYIEEYERRWNFKFGPEFARLCSDMISPDYTDTKLIDEFLVNNGWFVNTNIKNESDPQFRAIDYIKILSLIAIKRGYPNLFKQLQSIIFGKNGYFYDELSQMDTFKTKNWNVSWKITNVLFFSPIGYFQNIPWFLRSN